MISSRSHVLPGAEGASRGYYIHDRFWKHCQHLIMRLICGQEKGSLAKTRTLGSIEALMLLTEWHPRSLHFPPEADGWDSDLILSAIDDNEPRPANGPPNRWLEDVIEPARRSDRMSWMLLGCALSLAHELNVFEDDPQPSVSRTDARCMSVPKSRVRKLLYVFVNQLASRLGMTSMLPQAVMQSTSKDLKTGPGHSDRWNELMSAWAELTKLNKSFSEMVFPSKSFTQQLLRSGRYMSILEHFQPLLESWRTRHLERQGIYPTR